MRQSVREKAPLTGPPKFGGAVAVGDWGDVLSYKSIMS